MFDDSDNGGGQNATKTSEVRLNKRSSELLVQRPTAEELEAHEAYLDNLDNLAQQGSVWRQLGTTEESTEPPSSR